MSELFIVSTPIGNLSDITLRAIETLKNVDIILAEDTRNTSVLCNKYDIKTRLISYHKFSENSKCELVLKYLYEGKSLALVTDAGTPLISDPGSILVKNVKENGFKVTPIVGACAIIALLSCVFRNGENFKFVGFLPKKSEQIKTIFKQNIQENLVFYESPKRILETLNILYEVSPNSEIAIGRELTKKFEEIKEGNIKDIINYFNSKTEIKGEFVVLIKANFEDTGENEIFEDIKKLKSLGLSNKDISSILFQLKGYNKNLIKDFLNK